MKNLIQHKETKEKNDLEKKWMIDSLDEKILMLMIENGSISVNEISRQVNVGTTTLTKRIHHLKEEGFVERKGSKKKGLWVVNTRVAAIQQKKSKYFTIQNMFPQKG